jgi:CRISPR/Cas system-associated exonuclease Cas4 (RecB family)
MTSKLTPAGGANTDGPSPRPLPYVWVTWLTGFLSGDEMCGFAPWYRAHWQGYPKRDRPGDLTGWKARHGELVRLVAARAIAAGQHVRLEDQNAFRVSGKSGLVAGKPDLLAVGPDGAATVVDCKAGKPRDKDVWQVRCYQYLLPKTRLLTPDMACAGYVQYPDHAVAVGQLVAEEVAHIVAVIRLTMAPTAPPAVPSARECRFCDLTRASCPDRWEQDEPGHATTGDF